MSTQAVEGWVEDDSTFKARCALVKSRMGWRNDRQAAQALGMNEVTWRSWLRGTKPHDYEGACRRIADVTGCDYVWLSTGRKPLPGGVSVTRRYPAEAA